MSKQTFRIIPECHADTAMARFFMPNIERIDHADGSSDVAKEMEKAGFAEIVLVGWVDNDKLKNAPRYFDDFAEIDRGERVFFRQKEDFRVEHYLIILDRAIETFLMHNAAQVGINLTDFGFPENQKELQKSLKKKQIQDDVQYWRLLQTLSDKNAPDFIKIREFLHNHLSIL